MNPPDPKPDGPITVPIIISLARRAFRADYLVKPGATLNGCFLIKRLARHHWKCQCEECARLGNRPEMVFCWRKRTADGASEFLVGEKFGMN